MFCCLRTVMHLFWVQSELNPADPFGRLQSQHGSSFVNAEAVARERSPALSHCACSRSSESPDEYMSTKEENGNEKALFES